MIQSDFSQIADVINQLQGEQETHTILSSMLVNASLRHRNSDLTHHLIHADRFESTATTTVEMPVGMVASDRSAVLGRDGFMFLIGGSNDVLAQYSPTRGDEFEIAAQWLKVVGDRVERAKRAGVRFHQLIVPEKISILPELYPTPIAAPTRLLDHLERELLAHYGSATYTSARQVFWGLPDRRAVCKRADSHLSPYGTYHIFRYLIRELFDQQVPTFTFDMNRASIGDLSYRMLGLFVPETYLEVDPANLPPFCRGAIKASEFVPENGGHMGRRQVWKNPDAPIAEKVVVFGNSFFSFVETGQSTLSWWFSRWFREFHFVWTNEVDWEYVAEEEPSLVLWQGIERFLAVVPQH